MINSVTAITKRSLMVSTYRRIGAFLVISSFLLGACGRSALFGEVRGSKARQKIDRDTEPSANAQTLARDNTAFAVALYHQLQDQPGNLVFSPFSISEALAMVYAGAAGTTATQMQQTLAWTLPPDQLHAAFNEVEQRMAPPKKQQDFVFHITNSVWTQRELQLQPAYLNTLGQFYDAPVRTLDFQSAPDPARRIINDWVAQQTENKIKDLLPQGSIQNNTAMVLTNAIYFKDRWHHQFSPDDTRDGPFTTADGKQVTVPLMHTSETMQYTKTTDFQAVMLPYSGGAEFSIGGAKMLIILPEPGRYQAVEQGMTGDFLSKMAAKMSTHRLTLTLPKFSYTTDSISLKTQLQQMGMVDAFADRADFSGITSQVDIQIEDVFHKATITVDEQGTEAAAATGETMILTSAMMVPSATMVIDRPFIFAIIRDRDSDSILFLGRITDPSH